MSETPSKVRIFWLPVLFGLGALVVFLFFRGCKGSASDCPALNVDSLQIAWAATFPKDTIILPGRQDTIRKTRVVNLKDTAEVNALRRELEENNAYAAAQLASLKKALGEYKAKEREEAGLAAWNMLFRANTWSDSVVTPTYRHSWTIEAEGKILNYRFGIMPTLPDCPSCEPMPIIRKHRIGLFLGGQFSEGVIRPIYGGTYQYKYLTFGAGYLPKSVTNPGAFQITAGATIGIK